VLVEIEVVDFMKSWMEVGIGWWNSFSIWMKRSSNGNKKGEVDGIKIHVYLFELLDICVTILIVILMFQ
jgi:hypothetical protein